MSKDEFTKLFVYMERRFDALEKKIDRKAGREQVNKLLNTVDGIAAQQEIHTHEIMAMRYRLDCHDRWIHQLAGHTQLKLKHE